MELTEEKEKKSYKKVFHQWAFGWLRENSSKKNGDVFFNPFGHYLISRFIGSLVLDQSAVMHVSILDKYAEPGTVTMNGTKFILGADEGVVMF